MLDVHGIDVLLSWGDNGISWHLSKQKLTLMTSKNFNSPLHGQNKEKNPVSERY